MAFFKNIIRGGQTNIHQFRMIRQIFWVGFLFSFVCSLFYGVHLGLKRIPDWAWHQYFDLKSAELKVAFLPKGQGAKSFANLHTPQRIVKNVSLLSIIRDPGILDTQRRLYVELERIFNACWKLLLKLYLSLMLLWYLKGYLTRKDKKIRGSSLVSPRRLKWMIKRERKASYLKLDGVPLIKDKETSHMLITGTTGSGKSNCLNKLIPQIRKKGQKGIVVDLTGDFVSKHYNPEKDVILNPFDKRTELWSPWGDCKTIPHFDAFAAAFITSGFKSDPFWDNAARNILSASLEKLKEEEKEKVSELCKLLLSSGVHTLQKEFKGTRVSNLINKESEKTTGSILANLGTYMKPLVYVEDTERGFSIRDWIKDEEHDGFLFLTASPDQRETLRPLITAWLDIAINGLMSLPSKRSRRVWFIVDELPGLQRVPSLEMGLAESRKYGGCFVGGIQSVAQLNNIYGPNLASSLLDNFNTKIFFRSTNPETARWISRILGSYEQREVSENLSYGANTMRDGVNLSDHQKIHQLVTEGEVMDLKDLEAYIKLPESFPITKLKMKVEDLENKSTSFEERVVTPHKFHLPEETEETLEEDVDEVKETDFTESHQNKIDADKVTPEDSLKINENHMDYYIPSNEKEVINQPGKRNPRFKTAHSTVKCTRGVEKRSSERDNL